MISNLLKDIFNNQSLSFTLGICNIRSLDDLDWYLIKMPIDIIQFIHLGSFQLPNIRTRWIELIYTQGINVWYDMMIDDDNVIISSSSSDIINQLSQKYQVSSMTFLVKCLLQLGIIILCMASSTIEFKYLRQIFKSENTITIIIIIIK